MRYAVGLNINGIVCSVYTLNSNECVELQLLDYPENSRVPAGTIPAGVSVKCLPGELPDDLIYWQVLKEFAELSEFE